MIHPCQLGIVKRKEIAWVWIFESDVSPLLAGALAFAGGALAAVYHLRIALHVHARLYRRAIVCPAGHGYCLESVGVSCQAARWNLMHPTRLAAFSGLGAHERRH